MSQKITAKNLQYNQNLPPFLARLRGQNPSGADYDGPDPILAARRRPVKPRSASAEAEDAPLVVDEHGNAVTVTVAADGTVQEKEEESIPAGTADGKQEDKPTNTDPAPVENLANIGDQRKKRKIGKVIGIGAGAGADADEEDAGEKTNKDGSRGKQTTAVQGAGAKEKDDSAASGKNKTKKKAKKIKLSFGDDEG